MEARTVQRAGWKLSVIGLGAWQIGGSWGAVSDEAAAAVLRAAVDAGVTFIDTADVYGDGRSEQHIGRLLATDGATDEAGPVVATKMGRRAEQVPRNYSAANFRAWTDRSRELLGVATLDLVQLHCPPDAVVDDDTVFDALDTLVADGVIKAYGVSVETCSQALRAIARPGVASVQIIVNCLRQKPLEEVLPAAAAAGVGIIARVPLASGLLAGKFDEATTFAADDHRTFNRSGAAFDVGETFAGVPYEVGLAAARELAEAVPDGVPLARFALRWIIDQPGVTTVIPGARTADQVRANTAAASMPALTADQHNHVRDVYDRLIRTHVHDRW